MFGNSISHTKNQFSTSKNRKVGKQCILKSLLMLGYLKVNLGENFIFSFILGSMDLIRCPGEIEQKFWNLGSAKFCIYPISKHILMLLLQYVEQLQFL